MKLNRTKEGWKSKNIGSHNFEYLGSGTIYKCKKCGEITDLFNGGPPIKGCRKK